MASPRTPPAPSRLRLLPGARRVLGPIGEARGTARVMLWTGIAITSAFILLAVFAPVVSPYDFDQFQVERAPLRAVGGTRRATT